MNSIFSETTYTGKSIVSDAYLVFNGQKIIGISKTAKGQLLGKFKVLTPAFIDPHSHIGMERSGEPSSEGEANDQLDSVLALVDALDSVQMDDKAFRDAVESVVQEYCKQNRYQYVLTCDAIFHSCKYQINRYNI
jgi:imidazolonepropionase-like amidohydrolase